MHLCWVETCIFYEPLLQPLSRFATEGNGTSGRFDWRRISICICNCFCCTLQLGNSRCLPDYHGPLLHRRFCPGWIPGRLNTQHRKPCMRAFFTSINGLVQFLPVFVCSVFHFFPFMKIQKTPSFQLRMRVLWFHTIPRIRPCSAPTNFHSIILDSESIHTDNCEIQNFRF